MHTFLLEQQLLPMAYKLPDDLHAMHERGEIKGSYGARVTFSDELPFDIIRRVPKDFLSFSVDIEHIINATGIRLDDARLDHLVTPLLPAVLKIGGEDADRTYYNMSSKNTDEKKKSSDAMKHCRHTLEEARWGEILKFVDSHRLGIQGLRLYFALGYGPGHRKGWRGEWDTSNARELLQYAKDNGFHGVDVLGVGHEMNMHFSSHGVIHHPGAATYVRDIKRARKEFSELLHEKTIVVGNPTVFLPLVGERWGILFGFFRSFFFAGGGSSSHAYDFHYYPAHPTDQTFVGRYASVSRLLDHKVLNDVVYWTKYVEKWREQYSGHSPLWMGGTAFTHGADGEPGISDTYLGGVWWLDQVGVLAANTNVDMIIRDYLTGPSLNAMLDTNLSPRPDYWNTLLWKRIMGTKVYQVNSDAESLRAYAHSMAGGSGYGISMLFINLAPRKGADVDLFLPPHAVPVGTRKMCLLYRITAPKLTGQHLLINGVPLELDEDGTPTELEPRHLLELGKDIDCQDDNKAVSFSVSPVSYTFLIVRPGY